MKYKKSVFIGLLLAITSLLTFICTAESQAKIMGLNTIQNYTFLYHKMNEVNSLSKVRILMQEEVACSLKHYKYIKSDINFMVTDGPLESEIIADATAIADNVQCPR